MIKLNKIAAVVALLIGSSQVSCMEKMRADEQPILKIEMVSQLAVPGMATGSVSVESARAAMIAARYDIKDGELLRALDKVSGEGFWNKTILHDETSKQRIVCYGPGEYVNPHYHDRTEVFDIKAGGCHVWMSQNNGQTWSYNYCGIGELSIPANAWHCLIAGDAGLCMDVWNDQGRSIDWLAQTHTAAWKSDLVYPVSTQDLREATMAQLGY